MCIRLITIFLSLYDAISETHKAVMHVLVNDSTRGYGISLRICWMQRDKNLTGVFCPCFFTYIYDRMGEEILERGMAQNERK